METERETVIVGYKLYLPTEGSDKKEIVYVGYKLSLPKEKQDEAEK